MDFFKNIIGYESVKKELMTINDYFNNIDLYDKNVVKLPKGIILYGTAGCGKTLFIKEFCAMTNRHVVNIEGSSDDILKEIKEAFKEANYIGKSIIVIDELDLLINKDNRVKRLLQSLLDGFDDYGNVFVIASTNSIYHLEGPLLREGRFDRKIEIALPNQKTRKELIEYFVKKLDPNANVDSEYLSNIMPNTSCSLIQTVINDCYLRFDKKITTDNFEYSYDVITTGVKSSYNKNEENRVVAIHEAGHVLLIYKHDQFFKFYKAHINTDFNDLVGLTRAFKSKEKKCNLEENVARIEILMAGFLASYLTLKIKDGGSTRDLLIAKQEARTIVNQSGYYMPKNVLAEVEPIELERNETEKNVRRNEIYINRLMNKCQNRVIKYIKKNKKKLLMIADKLYENGSIDAKDLNKIMEA